MATVNNIVGGSFQDTKGNPLANGYIILSLNQDEIVNGNMQVCSGHSITIPLDINGNVVASPVYSVWPNDVLLPLYSFYLVSVYAADGQRVWGPFAQSILSSPSPFDLGAWIPGKIL